MSTPKKPVTVTTAARKIIYNGHELADLNPAASVDAVRRQHAVTDASLTTAEVHGPVIENGVSVYTIKARVATKG